MAPTNRFRSRKLNVRQNLAVLRESEIEVDGHEDDRQDAITSLPKVESGVESKEERELHLQAVISASQRAAVGGKIAQIYIPTPEVVKSGIQYDQLYPARFAQPATYIRFSSTVEDCIGVPYCISSKDEEALKSMNKRRLKSGQQCSEDWFEQVMSSFEDTTQARQPFAAVDDSPPLPFEELEAAFDESVEDGAKIFAKEIYEHWKSQRLKYGNHTLMPKLKTLKIDTGQEIDDSDPYVCFRRREVRQVRKTRGRDAQVADKLKKLRKELEEGRQLLDLIKQREMARKDDLTLARQVFEQRNAFREMKRNLDIREEDDDLLITQKIPKRRASEMTPAARPSGTQIRLTTRNSEIIATPESNLSTLKDAIARRELMIEKTIKQKFEERANEDLDFIDRTEEAMFDLYSPNEAEAGVSDFVSIKSSVVQQPTPPESVVDEEADREGIIVREKNSMTIRWATPSEQASFEHDIRYRRRSARLGEVIDRHNVKPHQPMNSVLQDRFRFDHEDGDEDAMDVDEDVTDHYGSYGFQKRTEWLVSKKAPDRASELAAAHEKLMRIGSMRGTHSSVAVSSA